jgi:hypothetical protein
MGGTVAGVLGFENQNFDGGLVLLDFQSSVVWGYRCGGVVFCICISGALDFIV